MGLSAYFRFAVRLFPAVVMIVGLVSSAEADVLDGWCTQVKLPSSIAICSDPELRALTIERQQAFSAARGRVGEVNYPKLLTDQNAWVASYPKACGISPDIPPPLPLSPRLKTCMAQAGRDRIAYLNAYGTSTISEPIQPTSPLALDCSRATYRAEKALCSDMVLRTADEEMSQAYGSLFSALPPEQRAGLLADQRSWIERRDTECEYARADKDYA